MKTWYARIGEALPSTAVDIEDGNVLTQITTKLRTSYDIIQIAYKRTKSESLSIAKIGHLRKSRSNPLKQIEEHSLQHTVNLSPGQKIDPTVVLTVGDVVDVSRIAIGKGSQGGTKRWSMRRGLTSHGSKSHRSPG